MKKIGILYLCLGKYKFFFKDFYESCEKNFLKNCDKTYYIFTNSVIDGTDEINNEFVNFIKTLDKNKIVVIEEKKRGWPLDSYLRFNFFNSCYEQLIKNDFLYFFNSNMLISEE